MRINEFFLLFLIKNINMFYKWRNIFIIFNILFLVFILLVLYFVVIDNVVIKLFFIFKLMYGC